MSAVPAAKKKAAKTVKSATLDDLLMVLVQIERRLQAVEESLGTIESYTSDIPSADDLSALLGRKA